MLLTMKPWMIACLFVMFGLLILIGLRWRLPAQAASTPQPPGDLDACLMAHEFVRNQLISPATAQFPDCASAETQITQDPSGKWTIKSYVDAQNGFGALLRNTYRAEVRYSDKQGSWLLIKFSMKSR